MTFKHHEQFIKAASKCVVVADNGSDAVAVVVVG